MLVSDDTIAELGEVLRRPKFSRYATTAIISEFLRSYVTMAQIVTVTEHIRECRDPKDDKFLELAVAGAAQYIITGDADLLIMNPFRGISILRPHEFLNIIADK